MLGFGELFPMYQCMVYNMELMQLLGELDIFSFVRISWLIELDFNRMDSKRKVSQVFNSNHQGSRLRRR